jgi:hypothetical protein
MDIYCPQCREPWDNDTLHEVASEDGSSYLEVARAFRSKGCAALGSRHGDYQSPNSEAISVIYDLLGDDMDGATGLMEDFGLV